MVLTIYSNKRTGCFNWYSEINY